MSTQLNIQQVQFLNPIAKNPLQSLNRQHCRLTGKLFFASTAIPLMHAKVWVETLTGAKFPVAVSKQDGSFVLDVLMGRGPSDLKIDYFGEIYTFKNISNTMGSVFHPGYRMQNDLGLVFDFENNCTPFVRLIDEKN
jgi:hypothetical protein